MVTVESSRFHKLRHSLVADMEDLPFSEPPEYFTMTGYPKPADLTIFGPRVKKWVEDQCFWDYKAISKNSIKAARIVSRAF